MLSGASSPPHLFVFGLGYVGLQVGLSAQELGWRVSGSVRAAEKATVLEQTTGIEVHTFDLDDEYTGLSVGGSAALADATHLVCTVPPVADLDRDPLLALHGGPDAHGAHSKAAPLLLAPAGQSAHSLARPCASRATS